MDSNKDIPGVRCVFKANGRHKPPTGHLYLRKINNGSWRLSEWDQRSNKHESREGIEFHDLAESFYALLTKYYNEWYTSQQVAIIDFRIWIGGYPQADMVKWGNGSIETSRKHWTRYMNDVKLELKYVNKQLDEALTQLGIVGYQVHHVKLPELVFGFPWGKNV